MRISITPDAAPRRTTDFTVIDFVPSTYSLRFKLQDDAGPELLHAILGGAGYSTREFAVTTDAGATFHGCRISTETGREIGVDFRGQSEHA